MARFRDRYNLFTGKFHVAPRPFVPPHWEVPEDYPSATCFWVEPQSGAVSSRCEGESWTFSDALKQWHLRQSGRVWASHRLVIRRGAEEATRRIKDLQTELNGNIKTANAFLDVLVSINYEACRLTRRAERAEERLLDTTRRVIQVAELLGRGADELEVAGPEAVSRARAAAKALDHLVDTLKVTVSPVERRFEAPLTAVDDRTRQRKDVCEWVRYATPSRKYRKPDLHWLLGSAVTTYLENKPDVSTVIACQRVSGYLKMLDAPFGGATISSR
ncbi:MAG: hypothetical protein PVJ49_07585 [Acidobacteriota bacterium]